MISRLMAMCMGLFMFASIGMESSVAQLPGPLDSILPTLQNHLPLDKELSIDQLIKVDVTSPIDPSSVKLLKGGVSNDEKGWLIEKDTSIQLDGRYGPQAVIRLLLESQDSLGFSVIFFPTGLESVLSGDAVAAASPMVIDILLSKSGNISLLFSTIDNGTKRLVRSVKCEVVTRNEIACDIAYNAGMIEFWIDNKLVSAASAFQHPANLRTLELRSSDSFVLKNMEVLFSRPQAPVTTLQKMQLVSAGAKSLLAGQARKAGNFPKAIRLCKENAKTVSDLLGNRHLYTQRALIELAESYLEAEQFADAVTCLDQARSIARNIVGSRHSDFANCSWLLSRIYQYQGDYLNSLTSTQEYAAILKLLLGTDNPLFVDSVENLATLYGNDSSKGKLAEDLYKWVLAARSDSSGQESKPYARTLHLLGAHYFGQRQLLAAEEVFLRAELIREKLDNNHLEHLATLNELSSLYFQMQELDKAEQYLLESKSIIESRSVASPAALATVLTYLANVRTAQGKFDSAESLYLQSLDSFRQAYGDDSPAYASCQFNVACVYANQNQSLQAAKYFANALTITKSHFQKLTSLQSESQQLRFIQDARLQIDSFILNSLSSPTGASAAYEEWYQWKGKALSQQRLSRQLEQDSRNSNAIATLREQSTILANLWNSPATPGQEQVRQKQISIATERVESAQRHLASVSESFVRAINPTSFRDLQSKLPENSILVDFAVLRKERVVAFLLRNVGSPIAVDCGPLAPIRNAVDLWRSEIVKPESYPNVSKHATKVRELVWRKIAQIVSPGELVLVSPDEILGRIPFCALPGSRPESCLIEENPIVILPIPRELLSPEDRSLRNTSDSQSSQYLIVGDVDYSNSSNERTVPNQRLLAFNSSSDRSAIRGSNVTWEELPATLDEIVEIRSIIENHVPSGNVITLRRDQASEENVKQTCSKAMVIHLATHGFFCEDMGHMKYPSDISQQGQILFRKEGLNPSVVGPHPDLLSGVVLANANNAWKERTSSNSQDGILTSLEIQSLPIQNCQLIVLSACETSLGVIANGEGILGLQRSFQISGANSAIASLWSVNDAATQTLMVEFYRNMLEKKQGKLEALRNAQLDMLNHYNPEKNSIDRSQPVEMKLVPKKDTKDSSAQGTASRSGRLPPKYWAAFQLSGDWR